MTISHAAILAAALTCGILSPALAAGQPSSQPPGPQRWIAASPADASYVAAHAIIRKNDYAIIWRMRNFAEARQIGDSQVRSVKYQVEYNCADRQQRALYSEMYAGSMATGKLVALSYQQHHWKPAMVGGHGFEVACQTLAQPAVVASAP